MSAGGLAENSFGLMKGTLAKKVTLIIIALWFGVSFIMPFKFVKADVQYTQTINTQPVNQDLQHSGITSSDAVFLSTTTAATLFGHLLSITTELSGGMNNVEYPTQTNKYALVVTTSNGGYFGSDNFVYPNCSTGNMPCLTNGWSDINFTFYIANYLLSPNDYITSIFFQSIPGTGILAPLTAGYNNADKDLAKLQAYGTLGAWWTIITTDENTAQATPNGFGASSAYPIIFANPPFSNGFTSPDFSNWSECVYIDKTALVQNGYIPNYQSSADGYFIVTGIGTGTSTPTMFDDTRNMWSSTTPYYMPTTQPITSECPITTKTASLSAGNYNAIAGLYFHDNATGSFGDYFIASSTPLNFTIVSGTPVQYPNQAPVSIATCPATGITFFGNDLGQAGCELMQYLFVPPQSILNQALNFQAILTQHAPFSYFYDLQSSFTNITQSSTSVIGLTLIMPTNTPISFSVDMFSANTINHFLTPSSASALRNVVKWSLYLAFASMVIWEVRKLFRGSTQ